MKKILKIGSLLLIIFFMTGCFGNDDKDDKDNDGLEPDVHESGLAVRMPLYPNATLFQEEKDVIGPIDAFIYQTESSVSEIYDWYIAELEKSEIYTDIIEYNVTDDYVMLELIFIEEEIEYKDNIVIDNRPTKIVDNVQIRFVIANPSK